MAVTENDIIQNAGAIAALVNGADNKNISDLDEVTSAPSGSKFHVQVSGVDKKIDSDNMPGGGGGGGDVKYGFYTNCLINPGHTYHQYPAISTATAFNNLDYKADRFRALRSYSVWINLFTSLYIYFPYNTCMFIHRYPIWKILIVIRIHRTRELQVLLGVLVTVE